MSGGMGLGDNCVMNSATHDDVIRLFPDTQGHSVVEILDLGPSLDELEAAVLLLGNQDEGLVDASIPTPTVISRIVDILSREEQLTEQERER